MHLRRTLFCSVVCASTLTAAVPVAFAQEREAPPVREVQEIQLAGMQGRLDHFTIDAKRKRVIFSGLGNNSVQIVDVFAGRMIRQIDGLAEPQGTPGPRIHTDAVTSSIGLPYVSESAAS